MLALQIKLLYTLSTPCIKVAPPGLQLGPGLYSEEAFIQGNVVVII